MPLLPTSKPVILLAKEPQASRQPFMSEAAICLFQSPPAPSPRGCHTIPSSRSSF